MRIETDMPLSSLIEKLLRGEAAEFHDEDFRTYVDSKMGNNHELLPTGFKRDRGCHR